MNLNRRQFGLGLAALSAAPLIPIAARAEYPISPAASALYKRAIVLDCNLAPPLEDSLPYRQEDIDLVRQSGVTAMKTSMSGFSESFEDVVGLIALVQRLIEAYPAIFMQIRKAEDFARAKREGKTGIIFSFEGVTEFEDKLDRISLFRNLGVRVMQLSYNDVSAFGAGVLAKDPASGLTELGRKAVETMNKEGIAIDLSHANPQTTSDVMAASAKPVLMTHAGCSAIHPHPRNKTDEQLRALASKGGVVGIYDLMYLSASPKQPTLDDYIDHMMHAFKICGEDHVGIGSDSGVAPFDTSPEAMKQYEAWAEKRRKAGVAAPEEDRPPYVVGLNTPRRCEVIADALLKRGVGERVAEKVLGANFVRAFSEIW